MMQIKHKQMSLKNLLLRGGMMGVLSGYIGFSVFILIEEIYIAIRFHDGVSLSFFLMEFSIGNLFCIVPTFLGGSFLAFILYKEFMKGHLSALSATFQGVAIGVFCAFILCSLEWFLINYRADWNVFILHSLEVIAFSAAAGGFSGNRLSIHIRTNY